MLQTRSWLPRTEGSIRLGFARRGASTALDVLHQRGAARARFPNPHAGTPEAVLLNMAGGLTGGDRINVSITMAAGTEAMLTTAAAEKIYRARDDDAAWIQTRLDLAAGARLAWLPQPTILFDRSRLERRTDVELADGSAFLGVECVIFGRKAMGEEIRQGTCRDVWRVRREGKLIFADALRLGGDVAATLDRRATLDGARTSAMLIYAAPDAAARIDEARALLEVAGDITAGASTWNGMLVVRALAHDSRLLVAGLSPLLQRLAGRPLPRVWLC